MKLKRFLLFVLLAIFVQGALFAKSFKDRYFLAEDYLLDKNYHAAVDIYNELLTESEDNANLKFKIGFCYVHSALNKEKAISYLEYASHHISDNYNYNSYKEKNAPLETLFYLGKAYHLNYEFSKAESTLKNLKGMVNSKDTEFLSKINHLLNECEVAEDLVKHPREIEITNVGESINSKYSDHSPVVSASGNVLIFASKRKGNTGGRQSYDGQYFEDIYISYFDGENYSKAKKISSNINTPEHEAPVGISSDGTKLLIFKSDDNGSLFLSEKDGSTWTVPQKLPKIVNSRFTETSATISNDYSVFYFTSDRKGGYGGLDIYKITKQSDGTWSDAVNMGSNINTPFDEEGPYIHPQGKKFFFASKGHRNMGGFDIFVSELDENGEWGKPVNVGYPINTPDDQLFVSATADAKTFYIVSRSRDTYGSDDIYKITVPEPIVKTEPIIVAVRTENKKEVEPDVKPVKQKRIVKEEQPEHKPEETEMVEVEGYKKENTVKKVEYSPAKQEKTQWCVLVVAGVLIGLIIWLFGRKKRS